MKIEGEDVKPYPALDDIERRIENAVGNATGVLNSLDTIGDRAFGVLNSLDTIGDRAFGSPPESGANSASTASAPDSLVRRIMVGLDRLDGTIARLDMAANRLQGLA